MLEAKLQRLILGQLEALGGVFAWRANRGAMRNPKGRMVTFGTRGQADILGVIAPSGLFLAIECKGDNGAPTLDQRTFGLKVVQHGALYIVAYTLDDVLVPVRAALAGAQRAAP